MNPRGLTHGAMVAVVLGWGGLIAPGAEISAAEPAVALPPFLVEAKGPGPSWRYAQSPEFEILSRIPDATTQSLAESFHRKAGARSGVPTTKGTAIRGSSPRWDSANAMPATTPVRANTSRLPRAARSSVPAPTSS